MEVSVEEAKVIRISR